MALLSIFVLASIVEAVVEYLFRHVQSKYKPYAAAAVAILLCCSYRADILTVLGLPAPIYAVIGYIVTGLLMARGAGWLNDFAGRWGFR